MLSFAATNTEVSFVEIYILFLVSYILS